MIIRKITLLALLLGTSLLLPYSSSAQQGGLAIVKFTERSTPQNSEIIAYQRILKTPLFISLCDSTGQGNRYDIARVVELIENPPITQEDGYDVIAEENISKIQSLIQQYPNHATKLRMVLSKWQNGLSFYRQMQARQLALDAENKKKAAEKIKQDELTALKLKQEQERLAALDLEKKKLQEVEAAKAKEEHDKVISEKIKEERVALLKENTPPYDFKFGHIPFGIEKDEVIGYLTNLKYDDKPILAELGSPRFDPWDSFDLTQKNFPIGLYKFSRLFDKRGLPPKSLTFHPSFVNYCQMAGAIKGEYPLPNTSACRTLYFTKNNQDSIYKLFCFYSILSFIGLTPGR